MKKKLVCIILIVALVFSVSVTLLACTPQKDIDRDDTGMPDHKLPDIKPDPDPDDPDDPDGPVIDDGTNSWENMGDEQLEINWFVESAAWPQPTGVDRISQKIKEVTGISVVFETPADDSGQKIGAMISGNKLPDVVSVPTSNLSLMTSLARNGDVYDINLLADAYAPSLHRNLSKDIWDWWAYGNGKTYGIPNHYYSYSDVPEGQLQPNGGMMVREDLFDKWQAIAQSRADGEGMISYTSRTTGQTKKVAWQGYITTPEGFREAAKWAVDNFKGTDNGQITTGLQLSQFKNGGSASLTWLAQYFAIPFEDEQGNYVYQFTTEAYEDMLYYLNELYNDKIISDGNFTQDYNGVGSVIAGGRAFATLATPQDYQMHFVTAEGSGYNYIPLYITNGNDDAPVLADIRGYGYMFSMITTNCKRPDLVIKLFDFLSSEEGQRLVTLGVEGETWNWVEATEAEYDADPKHVKRETDDGGNTVYKKIAFTEQYLKDKAAGTATKYGLMQFDLLLNYQYYDNVQPRENNGKTAAELLRANLKRPLTVYAYDYNVSHFVVDAAHKDFNAYNNALQTVNRTLGKQIPYIIRAKTQADAKKQYDATVTALHNNSNKIDLIISMNSEAYQKAKQKLGITGAAWPAWQQGYDKVPDRLHPNGDLSLYRSY